MRAAPALTFPAKAKLDEIKSARIAPANRRNSPARRASVVADDHRKAGAIARGQQRRGNGQRAADQKAVGAIRADQAEGARPRPAGGDDAKALDDQGGGGASAIWSQPAWQSATVRRPRRAAGCPCPSFTQRSERY